MEDSWLDRWLLERFRSAHTSSFGKLSARPGFDGLVEEVHEVMRSYSLEDMQPRIFQTYRAFFTPPLLAFVRLMVRIAPNLAHPLLVWSTPLAFRFLVGKSEPLTKNQLRISRCRFAEQAGADACLRACKLPTETFFREALEVELRLEPDHLNLSCTAELAPLTESHRRLQS
ncbi:MAG: DUF4033 domain-containing protein [Meiothermus sp.]|nr:DUF4033 domain-containing protein [Meiothermus sp.]